MHNFICYEIKSCDAEQSQSNTISSDIVKGKIIMQFLIHIVMGSLRKKKKISIERIKQSKISKKNLDIPETHSKKPSTKNGCHLINIILCHHKHFLIPPSQSAEDLEPWRARPKESI